MGFSSLAAAGVSGISSLLGASSVSDGAEKAAQAQAVAAQNAQNALTSGLQTSTNDLSPYTSLGSQASTALGNQLTSLSSASDTPTARYVNPSNYGTDASGYTTSGTANNVSGTANNVSADPYTTSTSMSQADLEATPGYQFTLAQGEKGVQNSAAARGLGVSGAALKGAATYATGLSDSTYNTRFSQEQSANAQNFSQANTAANTNFNQQNAAASTNYAQQSGANEQNFTNDLNANKQNASNALTAAAQNYGMDQTGFTDAQANKSQSYNMLTGTTGLGETATNALVGANTSAAVGTANALTGAGSAQAAAANATGQAYGSAYQGVGNALTSGIGNYNGYGIASAINPSVGTANTFGSSLTNMLTGSGKNSDFLDTVGNALLKNSGGSGGTNV